MLTWPQIIGAPLFFSTVWGWVKRWFDPVTVSKIFILGHHEVLPTLLSFIDKKDVPKQYGGDLDFTWGQMPNLDPAVRRRTTWENGYTDFPKGPLFWRPIDGDRVECVAVGSVKEVERIVRICTMPKCFGGTAAVVPEEATGTIAAVVASPSNGQAKEADAVAKLQGLAITEKSEEANETAVATASATAAA